jgi:hypothetical protein
MRQAFKRKNTKKSEADRVQRALAFLKSLDTELREVLREELDKFLQRGSRNKQR